MVELTEAQMAERPDNLLVKLALLERRVRALESKLG